MVLILPLKCQKCGREAGWDEAHAEGWLVKQRDGYPSDTFVIRCPDCITAYILKQVEED